MIESGLGLDVQGMGIEELEKRNKGAIDTSFEDMRRTVVSNDAAGIGVEELVVGFGNEEDVHTSFVDHVAMLRLLDHCGVTDQYYEGACGSEGDFQMMRPGSGPHTSVLELRTQGDVQQLYVRNIFSV